MTGVDDIAVCPWPRGKRWVYSITFDEALTDLRRFAIPILEQYAVPGHLEVVVGQMGQTRKIFQSSYNGFTHMGAPELREMLDRGWGVGCHSWSHTLLNAANFDRELGESKRVLEDAIGQPVTVFCAPGDNSNMSDEVLEACKSYGYLGAMGIFEALNRPEDEDLMWLKRTYLHDQGPITHDSEFDPFRKIQHAKRDQGWIIDYLHCPLEEPVHPRKDCSAAQLRERIDTVVTEGGDEVWLARVEEAVDYRYLRRHLSVAAIGEDRFQLSAPGLPPEVQVRVITLELPRDTHVVEIDGRSVDTYARKGKRLVDIDLTRDRHLRLIRG